MTLKVRKTLDSIFKDEEFISGWEKLCVDCDWSTPFQYPAFLEQWFAFYHMQYAPVFISFHDGNGVLAGLFPLVQNTETGELAVAGTHHAEYQCWLANPDAPGDFVDQALATASAELSWNGVLNMKYLPPKLTQAHFKANEELAKRAIWLEHARPLLRIVQEDIEASFKKKSNKSKINRLKREGELAFRQLNDAQELEPWFDQIIAFYDLKQGGTNNSFPFLEDTSKKPFHVALLKHAPQLLHITILTSGEKLISAHIGFKGRLKDEVHLAIIANSPFLANHSPGKIHIMMLSRMLAEQEVGLFDLTPGGDRWKERFANEHDDVAELMVFASSADKAAFEHKQQQLSKGKALLAKVGMTPDDARSMVAKLRSLTPATVLNQVKKLLPNTRELRVYRMEKARFAEFSGDKTINRNRIEDVLSFKQTEKWLDKQHFTDDAQSRFEKGELLFTHNSDDRLSHYGWLILNQKQGVFSEVGHAFDYPEHAAVLYDFYTHPDDRGKGLYRRNLSHILSELNQHGDIEFAYIAVLADNIASRKTIEKVGFAYQGSLFEKKWLGASKRWSTFPIEGEQP